MALDPQFAATPKLAHGALSGANTDRTGATTTNMVTTIVAPAAGTRVRRISVTATAATTAGMIRFFLHDGTTARPWFEVPVTAITPTASVPAFISTMTDTTNPELLPITLPSGWSIRATTHNSETFSVIVGGADL